jgi:hypothetical protein
MICKNILLIFYPSFKTFETFCFSSIPKRGAFIEASGVAEQEPRGEKSNASGEFNTSETSRKEEANRRVKAKVNVDRG